MTSGIRPHSSPPEAILNGHFAQVRFLLKRSRDRSTGSEDQPALPIAGSQLSLGLALCARLRDQRWARTLSQCFLANGARLSVDVDQWGMQPLHHAILYNRTDLVSLLLTATDPNFRIHKKDLQRNTPLHLAILAAEDAVLKHLLIYIRRYRPEYGVDPEDYFRRTPLMLAWKLLRFEAAELLMKAGANEKKQDAYGWTAERYENVARQRLQEISPPHIISARFLAKRFSKPPEFPSGPVNNESVYTKQRRKPPSNLLKMYPIPSDLHQPLYRRPLLFERRMPRPVFIRTSHHTDRRNDPLTVFGTTAVVEFCIWKEMRPSASLARAEIRRSVKSNGSPEGLLPPGSWRDAFTILAALLSKQNTESYKYVKMITEDIQGLNPLGSKSQEFGSNLRPN